MPRRTLLILFLIGLAVAALSAFFQTAPGYMDADYYYAGGVQIAEGHGLQDNFLWNYLDDPAGLPHPSHTYWMPMASFLAALGMAVFHSTSFHASQAAFVLIAALIPAVTASLAFRLTSNVRSSWLAGLLACLSGYYLSLLTTIETFGIYMLLGGLFMLAAFSKQDRGIRRWGALALGLIAGLMHLSRADGLLWLAFGMLIVLWPGRSQSLRSRILPTACLLVGYGMVMAPWMARNYSLTGSPFSAGGSLTLWLTDYNQTYIFPASQLTFAHWMESGLGAILQSRLWALGMNLLNFLGTQTSVFLLPLLFVGMWSSRKQPVVRFGILAWSATLFFMSFVFPFAGARGGFLHSGAAIQPLIWALAAVGLDRMIDFGKQKRGWNRKQAYAVFRSALLFFSLVLTVVLYQQRVIGPDRTQPAWSADWRTYSEVEQALVASGAQPGEIAMTINPPAFYNATGRQAIAVPGGDFHSVLAAAERYHARFLILERDQVNLSDYYQAQSAIEGLQPLGNVGAVKLFVFQAENAAWK